MNVESRMGTEFATRCRIVATMTTVSSGTESVRTNTRLPADPLAFVVSMNVGTRALPVLFSSNVYA
jgi:hypothetical protein